MFPISPSLIQQFIFKGNNVEHCPKRIMDTIINPIVNGDIKESELENDFFNTLCFGRSSGGVIVKDLPRKGLAKKLEEENDRYLSMGEQPVHFGEKTVDQIRLEQQALVFKQKSKKYMMMITDSNTHTPLRKVLNSEFCIIDRPTIFPTPVMSSESLKIGCFDVRITKDTNGTFGTNPWGNPNFIDNTDPFIHNYVLRSIKLEDNEELHEVLLPSVIKLCNSGEFVFRYWIFGYGNKSMNDKFIPIGYDKNSESEIKERLRKTMSLIQMYDRGGWKTNPSYNICLGCPLQKQCADYNVFGE